IYSLGVVLYEAMVGKPPFEGRHQIDIILKHINEDVPEPVAPRGGVAIPAAVSALVRKCAARDPNDRFQSMDEVLAALSAAGAPGTPNTGTFAPLEPAPAAA